MRLFAKICLAMCSSSVLFLSGCQHLSQPNKVIASPQLQDENNFNLQGKIGVRTPQQSGSAFFTWLQQQDQFDIELTGILGVGKTQIQGKPGEVALNSAKTGLITAASPEELLEKATGWQAPISQLSYWIQGQSAPSDSHSQQDPQSRLISAQNGDWQAQFSYANTTTTLPSRLTARHPNGYKVVMTINPLETSKK